MCDTDGSEPSNSESFSGEDGLLGCIAGGGILVVLERREFDVVEDSRLSKSSPALDGWVAVECVGVTLADEVGLLESIGLLV